MRKFIVVDHGEQEKIGTRYFFSCQKVMLKNKTPTSWSSLEPSAIVECIFVA